MSRDCYFSVAISHDGLLCLIVAFPCNSHLLFFKSDVLQNIYGLQLPFRIKRSNIYIFFQRVHYDAMPSILSLFRTTLQKLNFAKAGTQDYVHHMAYSYFCSRLFI